MILPNQRHLFDIPDDVAYLNCAYMSPLMRSVREAAVAGLDRKQQPWNIRPADFFSGADSLRASFAELIGAQSDDIAIVPAASYGVSAAAANLPLTRGQSVLVLEDQFPSNVYPWRERARDIGATIVTVGRPADGDWTRAVLEAIDRGTAIAALPQVHWSDGGLLDLALIGARCRDVNATLALDLTQSLGVLPFDVGRVKPDFLAVATYKWLLGPYSVGLLYVSQRWQEAGRPLEHNWIHRRNASDFSRLVDYQDTFDVGARRFDVGERSNFALVPAAEAAIRQILAWGVENVAETVHKMTQKLASRASAIGFRSLPNESRAGHYLALKIDPQRDAQLMAEMTRQRVFVSIRGDRLRVTPHLFNTDRDLERLLAILDRFGSRRAPRAR